jgi:hypothetical protein
MYNYFGQLQKRANYLMDRTETACKVLSRIFHEPGVGLDQGLTFVVLG